MQYQVQDTIILKIKIYIKLYVNFVLILAKT